MTCVQIPALYTGWTFFHIDLLLKLYCWHVEKTEINKKEAGNGPLKKIQSTSALTGLTKLHQNQVAIP